MAKRSRSTPAPVAEQLSLLDSQLDATAARAASDFTRRVGRQVDRWWSKAVSDLTLDEKGGNLRRTRRNEDKAGVWGRRTRKAASDITPTIHKLTSEMARYGVSSALRGNKASGWADSLDNQDRYVLDRILARRQREMEEVILSTVGRAQSVISSAVNSSQNTRELRIELAELVEKTNATLYRMVDRLTYEMAQTVIGRKAGVGTVKERRKDAFLYSGPIDGRCRNFCLGKVGRVWSKGTIDRMDNGQLPNTFVTRGGYNCRHLWRPVEGELAKLADTGRFATADMAAQHASTVLFLKRKGGKTRRVA